MNYSKTFMSYSTQTILFTVLFLFLVMPGCKKDKTDSKVEDNGLTKEINDFIPENILNEMKKLGMPINTGGAPPGIENIYLASPFVLKASNRPSDVVGMSFLDYKVKFYNQNNDNLTIKVDYKNGPETGNGLGGFIVGNDNKFTIFVEVTSTIGDEEATMTHVISGKLVSGGIENLYFANFMLDNNGNPSGTWIEEGEGRVIYDEDGMSEIQDSFKSATFSGKAKTSAAGVPK